MKEYIEREAAIATACRGCNKEFPNEPCEPAKCYIQQGLFNIPAADVVEVVRCKDCKYQDDCARQMVHTTRDYVLEQNISTYNKVDFCSYGAKMDGKGEGE